MLDIKKTVEYRDYRNTLISGFLWLVCAMLWGSSFEWLSGFIVLKVLTGAIGVFWFMSFEHSSNIASAYKRKQFEYQYYNEAEYKKLMSGL